MEKKVIQFVSNCFGEDRSAALIAVELKALLAQNGHNDIEVLGASLISEGKDYTSRGVELAFSSYVPPSGGFPTRSFRGFLSDLFSGCFTLIFRYMNKLKSLRKNILLTMAVGDVPLLILTRRGLGKGAPILFLAPAKSDYMMPHYKIEERYFQKNALATFTHDQFTADNLKAKGLNAEFLGNPMMDELEATTDKIRPLKELLTVGLLPGSRVEAYDNFMMMLRVMQSVFAKKPVNIITALPGTLEGGKISEKAAAIGFEYKTQEAFPTLVSGGMKVVLTRGVFAEFLHKSDLILGLAGTANEQAAGLGKPIVSFVGSGPQTTRDRIVEQEKLLGEALKYIPNYPDGVVEEMIKLLSDPAERQRRGKIGMEHMGAPGGAKRIAERIYKTLFAK